jgi:hypothetical protein
MATINPNTVEKALRKIDKYALEDGDIGRAEWHEVGQLIRLALGMQARIDLLQGELDKCRANSRDGTD